MAAIDDSLRSSASVQQHGLKRHPLTSRLRPSQAHWTAPCLMVASLSCGVVLAWGHHLFYSSLAGQEVQSDNMLQVSRLSVSQQRLNTAVGTAFAFLVKTFLALALTTTYVQIFWKLMKSQGKSPTISNVDIYASATANPLSLLKLSAWRKYPLLLVFAILPWLVPIAAIITPALLTTRVVPISSYQRLPVPMINFRAGHFYYRPAGMLFPGSGWPNTLASGGPRDALRRIVSATAVEAEVLFIEPPAINATWSTQFAAPCILCDQVSGSDLDKITHNIHEKWHNNDTCSVMYGFISWIPGDDLGPFDDAVLSEQTLTTGDVASFYVATFPNLSALDDMTPCKTPFHGSSDEDLESHTLPYSLMNASVLSCELYNSTYTAEFVYENGRQKVSLSSPPVVHKNDQIVEGGMGNIWFHNKTHNDWSMFSQGSSSLPISGQAYRSIIEAFAAFLHGTVVSDAGSRGMPVSAGTGVMQTRLADTAEFAAIVKNINIRETPGWLDNIGLNSSQTLNHLRLDRTLEELFQNVTLSLMSSPYFLENRTCESYTEEDGDCVGSKDYSHSANVTVTTWPQVYEYSARVLLITYGTVILLCLIAVVTGLSTIFATSTSYSNNFSTILRATRNADLSHAVESHDDGRDPLPSAIAQASITILPYSRRSSHEALLGENDSVPLVEMTHSDKTIGESQSVGEIYDSAVSNLARSNTL